MNSSSLIWTYLGGPQNGFENPVYGTLGVPNAANNPGARSHVSSWTDSQENFWIFGGCGSYNGLNFFQHHKFLGDSYNDIWRYNGNWTWMGGQQNLNMQGVYGPLGTPSINYSPRSRYGAAYWKDSFGNFWIFGGFSKNDLLCDLWKFDGNAWSFYGPPNYINQTNVLSGNQWPASRRFSKAWIDANGVVTLFGGIFYLNDANYNEYGSDVWQFTGTWTRLAASQRDTDYDSLNPRPGGRYSMTVWNNRNNGNAWILGGYGATSGPSVNDGFAVSRKYLICRLSI